MFFVFQILVKIGISFSLKSLTSLVP